MTIFNGKTVSSLYYNGPLTIPAFFAYLRYVSCLYKYSFSKQREFQMFVIFFLISCGSGSQDQDSLLMKRRKDNHSPGPMIRELVPSSHQES